jgi:hypothetical protein
MNTKYIVIYGSWHQRTILHLNEVYNFLNSGSSEIDLEEKNLKSLWNSLKISDVELKSNYLDFILAKTEKGIDIRYYEDGLHLLEKKTENIESAKKDLKDYYFDRFNLAISYIFSLGAPTAQSIAENSTHPFVVISLSENPKEFEFDEKKFGKIMGHIDSQDIVLYKTEKYLLIVTKPDLEENAKKISEIEIFLSEFTDKLRLYLNLHRKIWEEISKIKEKKVIKGKEVERLRRKLDDFQKLSNLIKSRTNQMDIFIKTRASISSNLFLKEKILNSYDSKFNSIENSLNYINKLWEMTNNYLESAIQNVVEIKNQKVTRRIESLQLITSIGVISGIIGYLASEELPGITQKGIVYFIIIIAITWLINNTINIIYKAKKYKIDIER